MKYCWTNNVKRRKGKMSNIAGTILTVLEYLEPQERVIIFTDDDRKNIKLEEGRQYIIPLFQRELRWTADNVNQLITDISKKPRFLGNIILSKTDSSLEIIDGQQRTTVLLMIIEAIREKYSEEIELFETCRLLNESFTGLSELLELGFCVDEECLESIKKTDKYVQYDQVCAIWEAINSSEILHTKQGAQDLLSNIKESEVNIIIGSPKERNESIIYFLDVNLKGVRLDAEDIFKGYLFSYDTSKEIQDLWNECKRISHEVNSCPKSISKAELYPLMKLFDHYFQCDTKYGEFPYGNDFFIKNTIEFEKTTFYKGTHIIAVINNRSYMQHALKCCIRVLQAIKNIITSDSVNDAFKESIKWDKKNKKEKVDTVDINLIFLLLKRILLGSDSVPKVLAFKYILSFLDEKIHKKEEYLSIYPIYAASVTFSVFAGKKSSEDFNKLVRQDDLSKALLNWIVNYYDSIELKRGKLKATYVFSENDESEKAKTREIQCKSIAALVNYFSVTKAKQSSAHSIKVDKENLLTYLNDTDKFSIEHLIIPDGKSGNPPQIELKGSNSYVIPQKYRPYKNYLFNYIFIPRKLNGNKELFGNKPFCEKIDLLRTILLNQKKGISDPDLPYEIVCKYTKLFIETIFPIDEDNDEKMIPKHFKGFFFDQEKQATEAVLNQYFEQDFSNDFLEFSREFIEVISGEVING